MLVFLKILCKKTNQVISFPFQPDNPKFNKAFLKALSAIQSKEYSDLKGKPFFTEEDYGPKKKKEKQEKPMTLKDYERHIILDHGGRLKDDEEEKGA